MKGIQFYELFGGIALRNHTFFSFNSSIPQDGLSKSKVDPFVVCSLRVKANSVCVYIMVNGSTVDVLE